MINQRMGGGYCSSTSTHAFPKNKTPVPTNDFKSYAKKKQGGHATQCAKLAKS
jgi:hypothetical protein